MPTGTVSKSANVGGIAMSGSAARIKDGQIGHEIALIAADDGVQLAYTGVDNVTVTLGAGNVVGNGDTVDVYWTVGSILYVKYGVTVALAAQVATLTFGAGDDYVTGEGTLEMNISKQITVNTDFIGNDVEMMAASCDQNSHMEFLTVAPASIAGVKVFKNEVWDWILNGGVTNPLAGQTVATIEVSNGDPNNAATLKIGILYDSA